MNANKALNQILSSPDIPDATPLKSINIDELTLKEGIVDANIQDTIELHNDFLAKYNTYITIAKKGNIHKDFMTRLEKTYNADLEALKRLETKLTDLIVTSSI